MAWQNLAGQGNGPAAGLALGDLQVTPLPVDTHTARMAAFSLGERWTDAGEPAGISGMVEFRTDVFDAASIEALIERLERVLVGMAADPGRRLSSLDLLDEAEHARLDGWGNQAVLTQPATASLSIPAVFATQVARAPEELALTFEGRSTTYRELDEAANRLAHLLVGQGVGPGSGWRCCCRGRLMRSWRFWRCSRPGRLTWRSTRYTLTHGSNICLSMLRRSPRSPPLGCRPAARVRAAGHPYRRSSH